MAQGRDPSARAAAIKQELGDLDDFDDDDNLGLFAVLGKGSPAGDLPDIHGGPKRGYAAQLEDDYEDNFDL